MDGEEMPGHTVLQVPVPRLEPFVRRRYQHYDPSYLSDDPDHLHAHITALGPFLDPASIDQWVLAQVEGVVATTEPFDFTLDRIDSFPDGTIHLRPQPAGAFRALTQRLVELFPECPPYGGEFPEVVPHLTLDRRSETVSESSTRELLGTDLPIAARADRLDLAWYQPNGSRLLRRWQLGDAG